MNTMNTTKYFCLALLLVMGLGVKNTLGALTNDDGTLNTNDVITAINGLNTAVFGGNADNKNKDHKDVGILTKVNRLEQNTDSEWQAIEELGLSHENTKRNLVRAGAGVALTTVLYRSSSSATQKMINAAASKTAKIMLPQTTTEAAITSTVGFLTYWLLGKRQQAAHEAKQHAINAGGNGNKASAEASYVGTILNKVDTNYGAFAGEGTKVVVSTTVGTGANALIKVGWNIAKRKIFSH